MNETMARTDDELLATLLSVYDKEQAQLILGVIKEAAANETDRRNEPVLTAIKELRQEMNTEFKELRQEMNMEFKDVRQEMNTEFKAVRSEMNIGFEKVNTGILNTETKIYKEIIVSNRWAYGLLVLLVAAATLVNHFWK